MNDERIIFIKQLKTCLDSGIPFKKSLEIMQKNESKNKNKIKRIYQKILAGENLMRSLHIYLKSPLSQHMTHIEKIHNLNDLLNELYIDMTNKQANKESLIKSLRYPLILLISTLLLLQINLSIFIPNCLQFLRDNNLSTPKIFNLILFFYNGPRGIQFSTIFSVISIIFFILFLYRTHLRETFSLYNGKNTLLWLLSISLKNGISPYESTKNIYFSKQDPLYTKWETCKQKIKETASFIQQISYFCKLSYLEKNILTFCQSSSQMSEQFMVIYKNKQEIQINKIKRLLSYVHPCCLVIISMMITFLLYCSLIPMLESFNLIS